MPVELVRMICDYLTPTQVASIRCVSRTIAAIGLEYIATTVTLTLKEESFDRLLEIAHHPVVSKYVQSLRYEHDFLTDLSRTQWEDNIITPKYLDGKIQCTRIETPAFRASKRAWRAYNRECSVYRACNTYGTKRLDHAYSTYQNLRAEQELACRSDFFITKLKDGLQRLPNLTTICMPSLGNYSRYQMEIAKSLDGAFYDQSTIQSDSVAVTRSILLAIEQAMRDSQNRNTKLGMTDNGATTRAKSPNSSDAIDDDSAGGNQAGQGGNTPNGRIIGEKDLGYSNHRFLQIRGFSSESLYWRLLLEDDEVFAVMKRSVSHLSKLTIRLLDDCWIKTTYSHFPDSIEAFTESLRDGRLQEFITSARGLEELDVAFGLELTYFKIQLTDIVDSFHWTLLRSVHLCGITIGVRCLRDFCSRHASTLSDLSLGYILVDEFVPGPRRDARDVWFSMFTSILEVTNLNKARVYGLIEMTEGLQGWDMDDHIDLRRASGTLVGRYLVGEGGSSDLEDFLREERLRISKEEGESSVRDNDIYD